MSIPEKHQTVMPYLILGDARAFINFMEKVFSARLIHKTMRSESIIMHAEIMIDECTIMFADATEKYSGQTGSFFIYSDDVDHTFKRAVDEGARVLSEPAEQSYGRSCGIMDICGNTWWITSVPGTADEAVKDELLSRKAVK